jgi:tetratricopeptide (TPR) repeat protein
LGDIILGHMNQNDVNLIELFYNEAIQTQKDVIKFGDFNPKSLNYFGKLKAKRSINYFQKILDTGANDFRLFFFIGKNYQSLKEFEKALHYLEKSVELNSEEPLLASEASIAALHLGLTDKALSLAKEAVNRNPGDESLLAIYAMYLLIAGKFTEAQNIINKAFGISPRDNFVIELKVIIDEVRLGHLTQPTLHSLFNR